MVRTLLESTRIYHDGQLDLMRAILFGFPVLLFIMWRLSSHGVIGADDVMRTIEQEIINDYRTALYREYGLYEDDVPGSGGAAQFPAHALEGLEVRFDNVAMSGSLFSVSANDEIGVRFDYRLLQDGVTKKHEENVYRCTRRLSRTSVWECGMVSYYLKYL